MKNTFLLAIFLMISISLSAQYRNLQINKNSTPNLKIFQIDFREFSTLIHFQCTNIYKDKNYGINANEDFYIKDNVTFKKYKMINSFNLPLGRKQHVFDKEGEVLNFTLEFEKVPETIGEFDIIENAKDGFCFYGVKIDKSVKLNDFLDIESFISDTPVKEYGLYYKDGRPVYYYKHKGLTIALLVLVDNSYGHYWQPNILIQNFTGKEIDFDPSQITVRYLHKNKAYETKVLSYHEYMKKVKSRQSWNSFAVSFGESVAASGAGYSVSTTQSAALGYSNSTASVSGFVGNTYGSIYGTSSTYSSTYGTSTTQQYNGAAAYAAQQTANNNISNYRNQQFQIRNRISDGYLKLNTLMDKSEYIGYINADYETTDRLAIDIFINGTSYPFELPIDNSRH